MIVYFKLFDLLNRKGMTKSDLRVVISSATIAKLSRHQSVNWGVIKKICSFLDCCPEDIMEVIDEKVDDFDILFDSIYFNINVLKEKVEKMTNDNDYNKVRQLDILVGTALLFFDENIKTL